MSESSIEIMFESGAGTVTGANFLLEGSGFRVLVDCGMVQGVTGADYDNRTDFPYDPRTVDALFITHAHIDHVGRIPKLVKDGFSGTIYSTEATKELAKLMLNDSAKLMDNESREKGVMALYTDADVTKSFSLWHSLPYHQKTKIKDNLSVTLKDSGHILGSSMYIFECSDGVGHKKNVLFTGDLGNSPSPLLRDTEMVPEADVIVMDSVYGDRNHEPKDLRDARFKEVVSNSIEKQGVLLIPAFSLERTQVILYELNNLIEAGVIPKVPVYLDSPLAIEVTKIYESVTNLYNKEVEAEIKSGDKIFDFPKLVETARVAESRIIDKTNPPKIIIAGSGMSTAGRILHHEEKYLPDPNNTLLLMGYQAPGTLGRLLEEGSKEVTIDDRPVKVKAKVEMISGYSAHKDSDHLVEFVEGSQPRAKEVFIVMGEPKSALYLAQRIRDELGLRPVVPEKRKTYKISLT